MRGKLMMSDYKENQKEQRHRTSVLNIVFNIFYFFLDTHWELVTKINLLNINKLPE